MASMQRSICANPSISSTARYAAATDGEKPSLSSAKEKLARPSVFILPRLMREAARVPAFMMLIAASKFIAPFFRGQCFTRSLATCPASRMSLPALVSGRMALSIIIGKPVHRPDVPCHLRPQDLSIFEQQEQVQKQFKEKWYPSAATDFVPQSAFRKVGQIDLERSRAFDKPSLSLTSKCECRRCLISFRTQKHRLDMLGVALFQSFHG